ncbi:MAG TPA: amidohydrolase family protein, partial [Candidatus Acidoferrales bacterium]|nr:amidohydrolase family protein [Candidatus Acidoferrales bacterium]
MQQMRMRRGLSALAGGTLLFVAVITALHLAARRAGADEPRYFAIKNVKIVPVSGPAVEGATVVIAKGLITAAGKDAAVPAEAWVIDGKGLTVYPGLVDALSDAGVAGQESAGEAAGGRGRARGPVTPEMLSKGPQDRPASTPWVDAADDLKADDKKIETWRTGGFTTALSAPKAGIFPGQGAVIDLAGPRPGDLVVKPAATVQVTLISPGGFFGFPGSLMGTIAYIRQVYLDEDQDLQAQRIYGANPRANERPDYDRVLRALEAAGRAGEPVLIPANTAPQLLRGMWLADKIKTRPFLYGAQQGYAVADALAAKKAVVLVNAKWPEKEKDADPEAEESLRTLRFRDRAPGTPAALAKAGVTFAFYDGGLAGPKDMLKNVKKAIDAGLAPEAALRALTLSTAEIYGVADRLGSIETGKIANLVVTDGDIFSDKTKIKFVFVDGRKFEIKEAEKPKEAPKGDLTGKWAITFSMQGTPAQATLDLTMAPGGSVTGTVTHPFGTSPITTGYLSGNSFSVTISVNAGDGAQEFTFSGTIEGNTIKGTTNGHGFSTEFTGTRPGSMNTAAAGSQEDDR